MNLPNDQDQRDRFRDELETNFSVMAAAGSGKTRAITDRIAAIAEHERAREWLPNLVVVTFTHRAADEMQRRARKTILEAGVSLDVLGAFDHAFFGTIHSFCVKLLNDYGHYLGLPPHLDLITDDGELWHDFVQSYTAIGGELPKESRDILLRHIPVRQLMELGRRGNFALPSYKDLGPPPSLDFSAVYKVKAKQSRSLEKIERDQAELRTWEKSFHAGNNYLPLIECTSGAGEFTAAWDAAWGAFRAWLTNAALAVAADVQRAYRDFRIDHGVLTYDDQVALADSLFDLPAAAQRIRERRFRVILDEAQDTDPKQFAILLETARPPEARDRWLETKQDPPCPGHFCMVGDLQQSIFGDRADLRQYRRIHAGLTKTGAGESLKFVVTFRLDQRQVDFINTTFPHLLNDDADQVPFLRLRARPTVLPGQIVRLNIQAGEGDDKRSERQRADLEAKQLVDWMKKTGLEELRSRCWSEVAILCPRKAWFRPLRDALRRAGFEVQTQSESELNADNPTHAWTAALATIMTRPRASYEIVGVLREVFGLSDHDLATFAEAKGSRFQIQFHTTSTHPVAKILNQLVSLRETIQSAALYQAVRATIEGIQLRERLLSLPTEEFGNLDQELDRLLVLAATAETEGKTLGDFARDLRGNFDTPREGEPPQQDAVQLITGQKAKGSEWDCVIVPFLSREVRPRSPDYARIVKLPETGELIVALGRDDMSKDVKEALKRADRQEMERLLYVALTRARHTLVLAFDEKLFHTAKGLSPSKSQASWLRAGEVNRPAFDGLLEAAAACDETQQFQSREAEAYRLERELGFAAPEFSNETKAEASKAAAKFVRKLTPSLVARKKANLSEIRADAWKEIDPELRPLTIENAATRYGKWWHDFAQQIPWRRDPDAQAKTFETCLSRSPEPARSRREWKKLSESARANEELRAMIENPAVLLHSEIPFLWPGEKNRCVEGIIDLALFDPVAKGWLILDWKTNRIDAREAAALCEQYLAQVAAYWKAVTEMTRTPVAAQIYSTATGEFIAYDTAELESEWERLKQLTAEELTSAMGTA